jgi:hypothetical protein
MYDISSGLSWSDSSPCRGRGSWFWSDIVNLLKLIAHADPAVCDVQDEEMKTPLHIACDNSCVLFEEDHDEYAGAGLPPPPPCHMSVKTLLACSLRPVTLQDAEGKSPLQHAVASNALSETITLLQMAVMKSSSRKRPISSVTTPAEEVLLNPRLLEEHSIHILSTAEPTVSPRKRLRRTISFH